MERIECSRNHSRKKCYSQKISQKTHERTFTKALYFVGNASDDPALEICLSKFCVGQILSLHEWCFCQLQKWNSKWCFIFIILILPGCNDLHNDVSGQPPNPFIVLSTIVPPQQTWIQHSNTEVVEVSTVVSTCTTVFRVIFASCYFHPSALANGFVLSWIRPNTVALRRDKMRNLYSLSLKFACWQWEQNGQK